MAARACSPASTCGIGASAVPAEMIASPHVVAATDSVRRGRPSRRISWCRNADDHAHGERGRHPLEVGVVAGHQRRAGHQHGADREDRARAPRAGQAQQQRPPPRQHEAGQRDGERHELGGWHSRSARPAPRTRWSQRSTADGPSRARRGRAGFAVCAWARRSRRVSGTAGFGACSGTSDTRGILASPPGEGRQDLEHRPSGSSWSRCVARPSSSRVLTAVTAASPGCSASTAATASATVRAARDDVGLHSCRGPRTGPVPDGDLGGLVATRHTHAPAAVMASPTSLW